MKIGIDIGGSHVGIGILEIEENKFVIKEKFEKNLSNEENKIAQIEDFIVSTLNRISQDKCISEIGISMPGKIIKGIVEYSPNLNIEKYDLESVLREKLKYDGELKIRNDGKCAAIAEKHQGMLREYDNGIFLCIGTGIGGAILNENRIHEQGAEFGHMVIHKDGKECSCKRHGCFEKYASMRAFKEEYIDKSSVNKNKMTSEEILEELTNKFDYEKEKVVDEYIRNLSIGISNIYKIFSPDVVVIGGSFVYFKEIFVERLVMDIITAELPYKQKKDINIQMAKLQNDAGIIGSII